MVRAAHHLRISAALMRSFENVGSGAAGPMTQRLTDLLAALTASTGTPAA